MNKKDFSSALRKTAMTQKSVIDDRFANADSVLLSMKPEEPTPTPVEVASPGSPAKEVLDEGTSSAPHKGDAMVVRDTFSMPPGDHGLIEQLRIRAAREGRNTNKSEVVRAGLHVLSGLAPSQLLELLESLERIKPGRK